MGAPPDPRQTAPMGNTAAAKPDLGVLYLFAGASSVASLMRSMLKAKGIPYVGCCPSSAHAGLLTKRLELLNFEAMAKEGTAMFKKELADVLAELGLDKGEEREALDAEPGEGAMKKTKKRALGKPKAKGKGHKRPKRAKAAGEDEEEEVEVEEDEGDDPDDDLEDLMD